MLAGSAWITASSVIMLDHAENIVNVSNVLQP